MSVFGSLEWMAGLLDPDKYEERVDEFEERFEKATGLRDPDPEPAEGCGCGCGGGVAARDDARGGCRCRCGRGS